MIGDLSPESKNIQTKTFAPIQCPVSPRNVEKNNVKKLACSLDITITWHTEGSLGIIYTHGPLQG